MRDRSDETLMKSYAGGSMEAFEELYARHRGPLYRYILRQVGNATLANDLYQGSWEKIIKARSRYKRSAPFKAWMYRIAHNHVMDHFRRERTTADVQTEKLADEHAGPDELISAENRQRYLIAAINKLPFEQKDALMLKLETGLDLQAIADVTGVNRETAKSRLRYAVRKLRKVLSANDLRQEE
jgi:RNA polymerase sigma-70 factor (ECF subfamily)